MQVPIAFAELGFYNPTPNHNDSGFDVVSVTFCSAIAIIASDLYFSLGAANDP